MEEITKLIDDLQPQAARYDTPIADDLLICTFPNGSRTWIFTYTAGGTQHRRSLGVYPEMSLADARQALCSARKLQQAEAALAAQGLATESHTALAADGAPSEYPEKPRRWLERRTVSAALAGGLMSIAIYLGVRQLPVDLLARLQPSMDNAAAGIDTQSAVADEATPSSTPGITDENVDDPAATKDGAIEGSPVALSPANEALLKVQQSLRGTVARDTLARGIEGDRPVQTFDARLALANDGPTTLYYFTEVRGMAGATVLHRWLHEGKVVSETSMQVGEGWLADLHSSTTIQPRMTGPWQVMICDASGKVLESEQFDVAPTEQLSSTVER
jgi:hypothetical protein